MADNMKWTSEQRSVIDSRDQSLLVSAAAGSGKTAVLVQRILDQILDPVHPVEIDRMLIVTFTNAAAAQLRQKIRDRLEDAQEEAAAEGDEKKLDLAARQLALLAGDHIETIDRFCREVVLDHAAIVGVDPAFRIGDDGEMKLLRSDAVAEAIENAYASEDTAFVQDLADFSDLYAPGRMDNKLEDLILRFYMFSQSHAFPRIWRRECAKLYRGSAQGTLWMESFLENVRTTARELRELVEDVLEVSRQGGGPYQYTAALESDSALLSSLEDCRSTEEFHALLNGMTWAKLGREKKNGPYVEPSKAQYVKTVRDKKIKEGVNKLICPLFSMSEEETDALRHSTARFMDVLVRLTDLFEDTFGQMKKERNIADFSDVAHNALRILIRTDEDGVPVRNEQGEYIPTAQADEYAAHFEQIYIDEYQDSNPVQELLLWSVSGESAHRQNRFMVGDVKQSIYRFRMADPEIFTQKAQTWPEDAASAHRRIDLHSNFRSRKCVIDAVNLIFRQIMRREVGGITYDDREELTQGFPFPEDTPQLLPELLLIQSDDVADADSRVDAEAQAVAQKILQMVGRTQIYDKETKEYRPVEYGDITILLRSSKGWALPFSRALSEHGIPNRSGSNTGYFDAPEVRTILSYLNVLDNPRQDIPLAASLRSQIGHLDDREMAVIRSAGRENSFYDCVLHYMECGEDESIRGKLERFAQMTKSFRSCVKDTPIHILLWKIYDETGYADALSASPGGLQKRANLDLLADKAIAYEATSYRGLFHFIRYIEKLRKSDMDFGLAESTASGGNEVSIMTMHASKGLEFPVVFVSGLGKQFNRSDSSSALVLHARLGAGLDHVDADLRVRTPTRIRKVIADQIKADSVGEELRILYVAMTRAEQKLILSGCVKDREDWLEKTTLQRGARQEKYAATMILQANCMLEWVVWGLMRHAPESVFFDDDIRNLPPAAVNEVSDLPGCVRIVTGEEIMKESADALLTKVRRISDLSVSDPEAVYDPALRERLAAMLSMRCEHESAAGMPGKLSVSDLKHAAYEAEMQRLTAQTDAVPIGGIFEDRENLIPKPAFLQEEQEQGMSGTALGTAYHEVLAAADFGAEPRPGQVAAQLETMVKCDKIQKDEALRIDPGRIERFLKSDLAGRMRAAHRAGNLWREQPFVIGLPGNEISQEWSGDETVLIQGIIDAFFVEDGKIILLDYKTDRAQKGDEQSLVNRYRKQFELYAAALERLLGMNVTQAWLYSLSLGEAIRVPL